MDQPWDCGINTQLDWAEFSNHNTHRQLNKLTFQIVMPHSNYEYAMLVLHVCFTVDFYLCFSIFDPGEPPLTVAPLYWGGMGLGFDLPQVACPPPTTPSRSLKNHCHNHHIFTCFFNRFSLSLFNVFFFSFVSLAWFFLLSCHQMRQCITCLFDYLLALASSLILSSFFIIFVLSISLVLSTVNIFH